MIHVQLSNWSVVRGNICGRVNDCRHISEAAQRKVIAQCAEEDEATKKLLSAGDTDDAISFDTTALGRYAS